MKLQLLHKNNTNVKPRSGRFAADGMPYVDLIEIQVETRCSAVHQFFYSLQVAEFPRTFPER